MFVDRKINAYDIGIFDKAGFFYLKKRKTRRDVKMAEMVAEMKIVESADFLFGYANGDRVMISNTAEQISAFIVKHRFDKACSFSRRLPYGEYQCGTMNTEFLQSSYWSEALG